MDEAEPDKMFIFDLFWFTHQGTIFRGVYKGLKKKPFFSPGLTKNEKYFSPSFLFFFKAYS